MAEAADAAEAWWEELQAWEARKASVLEEVRLLGARMREKDFLAGMSEAEQALKLAEAKEERSGLFRKHRQFYVEVVKTPDFSGMTEDERAAVAERLRNKELQRARRLRMEGDPNGPKLEALARLVDFDPKQDGLYYSRFTIVDLTTFDLDEESPYGPMRYTDAVYKSESDVHLSGAVNILSVKIACSDVGFPIHVYGTIIVRDSVDDRCVYQFRRDGDHCQLINSEGQRWRYR